MWVRPLALRAKKMRSSQGCKMLERCDGRINADTLAARRPSSASKSKWTFQPPSNRSLGSSGRTLLRRRATE